MKRQHIYRQHDHVRVVTPKIFLRCGYPYDIVEEGKILGDKFAEDIVALIDKIDPREHPTQVRYGKSTSLFAPIQMDEYPFVPAGLLGMDYEALCGRIARIIAQRRGFGGNERSIYTKDRPELTGAELIVTGKIVRKTGTRSSPSSYQSYDGDWEYDSGGLWNERTHVILECYQVYDPARLQSTSDMIRIEAANVEPIMAPAEQDA
jgi:hypothetical protein